jgi:muramoyltetrapeptide carboxypeptidase
VLGRQKAILLGHFDPITPMPNDNGFSLDSVVARLRHRLPCPAVAGLPLGHVAAKITLPVGLPVELTIAQGSARLQGAMRSQRD